MQWLQWLWCKSGAKVKVIRPCTHKKLKITVMSTCKRISCLKSAAAMAAAAAVFPMPLNRHTDTHHYECTKRLLTLDAHAQEGYSSCLACLSFQPYSSKLSNKASYQRFQQLQLYKIKKAFCIKTLCSEVMIIFSQLSLQAYRGSHWNWSCRLYFDDRAF